MGAILIYPTTRDEHRELCSAFMIERARFETTKQQYSTIDDEDLYGVKKVMAPLLAAMVRCLKRAVDLAKQESTRGQAIKRILRLPGLNDDFRRTLNETIELNNQLELLLAMLKKWIYEGTDSDSTSLSSEDSLAALGYIPGGGHEAAPQHD